MRDPRIDPRPGDVTMNTGDYTAVYVVVRRYIETVVFSQINAVSGRAIETEPMEIERWIHESQNEKVLHVAD